jgi:uncharacterized protein (TIGR00725 family)
MDIIQLSSNQEHLKKEQKKFWEEFKMTKIQIGVIGGAGQHNGQSYDDAVRAAYKVGIRIAEHDAVLVTGATSGLPYAAVLGAKEVGGLTLGISGATNPQEHVEVYGKPLDGLDSIVYTGGGHLGKEVANVTSCDGIIAIGGGPGTMTEVGIALRLKRPIGFLKGVGGFSDRFQYQEEELNKYGSRIFYDSNPKFLASQIAEHLDEILKLENLIKTSSQYGVDVRKILEIE